MSALRDSHLRPLELSPPVTGSGELHAFLAQYQLEVFDVSRGAGTGTRRLVVADPRTSMPTHVVAVAARAGGWAAVESEIRHLHELDHRLRPEMRATVPSVVRTVDVGGLPGAVLSAVPGTMQRAGSAQGTVRQHAAAVLAWLTMLWEDTAGPSGAVDLGREAYDDLLARFAGPRTAAATIGALHRSRSALAGAETARTVSHGCLCPDHVRISEGRVTGVDDWGMARFDQDPLRDLGGWVVSTAGPRIAAVLTGRSRTGRHLRDLMANGLGHWGLPGGLWRDVLVLALAEAAVAGLARDDTADLELLGMVSQELSRNHDRTD